MNFEKGKNSIYVGNSENDWDAIIEYKDVEDGVVDAYHTEVKESLAGQGVARKLVENLVDRAREEKFKIVPTCSYAKKVLESSEEYSDVLAK